MKIAIVDGDDRTFRAAAFGLPDRETVERSYDRLKEFSRGLTDKAREGLEKTRHLIETIYDDTVRSSLRKLNRSKRGLYRDNIVQYLDSPDQIATAPMVMRRWILAHPAIRSLYDRQSLDAWGSKPGAFNLGEKGSEDAFWASATNGRVSQNDKGEWWSEYTYGANTMLPEVTLSLEEQMDVLATYDVVENAIEDGIDCTSPLGELL